MDHLFSPFKVKGLEFKNRIVMPGLASFLIENDGSVTEKTIEHYRKRAAGGPSMVIVEACAVSAEGIVSPHQGRIHEDRLIDGWSKIARTMKAEGAIPAVQIHHSGRQTSARIIKQKPFAPSPLPCPTIRGEVQPLTIDQIHTIVKQFGDAAVRAVEAGFEMIEIHGAHGYLINQFLSRFSNIREDEYGGDVANRTRIAKEVVEEIRRRVGPDYPLSFKISAQEFVPNGLGVVESIEILKILEKAGVDLIQVSGGNDATPEWICQPMFMEKGCFVATGERIKKALSVPVMVVGRINDPFLADDIIREGKADLVCIGRGLLADPELPKKAQAGQADDIRICIACNTCMESIFRKGHVECLVNPSLGHETEMVITPTQNPRKIIVVGGGPGGLNVAWVAAKRGHTVHLYEKESVLGGQLVLGSVTAYKKELLTLIRFQERQIEKFGVQCHLNQTVTPALFEAEKPDVVILATGSLPFVPDDIEGIDQPHVVPFNRVLDGDRTTPCKVIMIGGGPTGCELSLHLSNQGCAVTIVEVLPEMGRGLETMTRKILLRKLQENNVETLSRTRPVRIEKNGVVVVDAEGQERLVEGDRVVVAAGTRPDKWLYEQIKNQSSYEVYQIGDCLEPRTAKTAIYEGAVLGRSI